MTRINIDQGQNRSFMLCFCFLSTPMLGHPLLRNLGMEFWQIILLEDNLFILSSPPVLSMSLNFTMFYQCIPLLPLHRFPHILHRSLVLMSRTRDVVHPRYAKHSCINHDCPIHNESRGMRNRWEEREDESNKTESER